MPEGLEQTLQVFWFSCVKDKKTLKFLRIVESAIVEKVSPVLEAGLMAGQSMCPWWHRSWHSSRPGCPGNLRQDKVRGVGEGKSSQPNLGFGETAVNHGFSKA